MTGQARTDPDDRAWEHHLLPLLVSAFAVAAGAALGLGEQTPAPPQFAALPPAPEPAVPAGLPADALVLLRVADVVLGDGDAQGVVLLADSGTHTVLPVWVSTSEAELIRKGLGETPAATRATAPGLGGTVAALGGDIVRVEVDPPVAGSDDPSFGSHVVVERRGELITVDARMADALALALATGKPVFTSTRLLGAQGIARDAILRRPEGLPSGLRPPERL